MDRSRALLCSTVGFVALYGAAVAAVGNPPGADDSGTQVMAWVAQRGESVQVAAWLAALALPLFAVYTVLMRGAITGLAGRVFMVGATGVGVLSVAQYWSMASVARGDAQDPASARALLDSTWPWGPMLIGFTVVTLGAIAVASRDGSRIPMWVGVVAIAAFVQQLVQIAAAFVTDRSLADDGPMTTAMGSAVTILVFVLAGVSTARRRAVA